MSSSVEPTGHGADQATTRAGAIRDPAGDRRPGSDARARADLPADRRPSADRGRAGPRQDAHGQDDRRRARRHVQPHPVHARPRALRPHRHAHLPRRQRDVRHRARPGLLQLPARGRDQPRAREGAVGAARGDAGAPGHARAHDASGAGSVPRDGDAEPDRVRGHLPAARGAGRPLHAQDPRRLPAARRGADGDPALARGAARSSTQLLTIEDLAQRPGGRPRRLRRSRPRQLRAPARDRDAPARPSSACRTWRASSRSAPARAGRSA